MKIFIVVYLILYYKFPKVCSHMAKIIVVERKLLQ